ncbi:MAG: ADYC domain-containing protein [Myxococcota bacterium]
MRRSRTERRGALALALASALASGCLAELDVDQTQRAAVCPVDQCGANAATLNNLPFGELYLPLGPETGYGQPAANNQGLYVAGAIAPNGSTNYSLRGSKGHFSLFGQQDKLIGTELIGTVFEIASTVGDEPIEVVISDYRTVESWTSPIFNIDQYQLEVRTLNAETGEYEYRYACPTADVIGPEGAWVVILSGERYDWDQLAVRPQSGGLKGWFTIACTGHALAKMKLMGYEAARRQSHPFDTTLAERQAALKMLTGDFCGTGRSFTLNGTPLFWHNHDGWSHNSAAGVGDIEARWDDSGALCLDTPRMSVGSLAEVHAECATVAKTLPSCQDDVVASSTWTSVVPITE